MKKIREGSELKGLDLNAIVEGFKSQGFDIEDVNELITIDDNGDLRVFPDQDTCFDWIYDSESSMICALETIKELTSEDLGDMTVLEYMLSEDNILTLEDGTVVFIYY